MKINEKDITKIVKESVLRLLQETNRIQPWKGNPLQIDPNWADVRKRDEELAAQLGDKKAPKRSAVKNYGDIKNGSVEDMIISHYQDEISKNAVERAKEYISGALGAMLDLGSGSGPMNHGFDISGHFAEEKEEC